MNATLYSLDRPTHMKIVMVAAIAAALVFAIGKTAQFDHAAPGRAISVPVQAPRPAAPSRAVPKRLAPKPDGYAVQTV